MASFQIPVPAYAQDMLWLTHQDGFNLQLGQKSSAKFPAINAETPVKLRWGHMEGSPLHAWSSPQERYQWDGLVRVAGHIEAIHIIQQVEGDILIAELMGSLIRETGLPSLETLRQATYQRPTDYVSGQYWYSFALSVESPFADFLNLAMTNGQAVRCTGIFAAEETQLQRLTGMPLILDSLTILAN